MSAHALSVTAMQRGTPAPIAIPLKNVQVGQLFVPAAQADIVCALAHDATAALLPRRDDGALAVICIAAKDTRHVGLVVYQAPNASVRVVELVAPARYVPLGQST